MVRLRDGLLNQSGGWQIMKGMVAYHRGRWLGREMVDKSGWRVANNEGMAKQRGRWLGREMGC